MPNPNLERMIQLAEEFFKTRSDPEQISVTEETMQRLLAIHPNTLSEERDENGPIAWVLVIPTTYDAMDKFITGKINEKELLDLTPTGVVFDAVYLCSALVLPEHRGKGLAKHLSIRAIRSIQNDHPIKHLYYWAFSIEGERLAQAIAKDAGLPLHSRTPD